MAPSQYSVNTSNYEFATAPRNSYPNSFPVRFYLNHFRSSTVDYVLDEAGWSSITEFEDKARQYDMFTTHIAPNGFLVSSPPQVDPECFRVFEFSLHHLKRDVLERIMYYYIGMNLTDYELQFPEYNSIYLAVPYYSWLCAGDTCATQECADMQHEWDCSAKNCKVSQCDQWKAYESSDSETDVSVECLTPVQTKLLSTWNFKLNRDTKNSYILHPSSPITKVSGGHAYWGTHTTPTTWKLKMSGLERPLYYSSKYGGWIVSLKLGDALIENGATFKI